MPREGKPEPATCADGYSGSDNDNTKPGTTVSAARKKDDKKGSKKHSSHHKKKKSKSDDGIVRIEKGDGEVTVADNVRVNNEHKDRDNRRKSQVSAAVGSSQSPRKSSMRPVPSRDRAVTWDRDIPRHNKNDKQYFGRRDNEDVTYIANDTRPPGEPRARPSRPLSYDSRLPPMPFQPVYSPLIYAASPGPYAQPPMAPSYEDAYFGQQPKGLSERFGRTGQPTLNDAHLSDYTEPRRQPRHERRRQVEYEDGDEDDEYDEDYDPEADHRIEAAEEARRQEKRRQQKRLIRAAEQVLEQKRIDDIRAMPPPLPRRQNSHRNSRPPPRVDYSSHEDMREHAREHIMRPEQPRRGSFTSERPLMYHRESEPGRPVQRLSFTKRPPSSSSAGYDLPRRSRHPDIEVSGSRRRSFYGGTDGTGTTTSSTYEERASAAEAYQRELAAEAKTPLTADWLNKQQKQIGSGSRSTRSTASRDDSEFMQSATTRTTRSGSGDGLEGQTIMINGTAKLKIGGAEVNVREEDGPVEIAFRDSNDRPRVIRNGSEASQSVSGTTAVSDDYMSRPTTRPGPNRRESTTSHRGHRYRSSVDDGRYPPRVEQNQHLRERLNPAAPGFGRRSSHKESRRPNTVDYERDFL